MGSPVTIPCMTDDPVTNDEPSALIKLVDKALAIQQPAIDSYVENLRKWTTDDGKNRSKRDGTPAAAIRAAERQYISAVTATGAGAGATAAVPGVGTAVSMTISLGEAAVNLETTAMFVLSCASIHGIDVNDLERRRTLLYAVVLGKAGASTFERIAGRTGPHWAKKIVGGVNAETLRAINRVLGRNFVTKYGTKQGILVLGKAVPFGLGAVIGGGGNFAFGQLTVRSARHAFGQPPGEWTENV